jgi:hypothetical protein
VRVARVRVCTAVWPDTVPLARTCSDNDAFLRTISTVPGYNRDQPFFSTCAAAKARPKTRQAKAAAVYLGTRHRHPKSCESRWLQAAGLCDPSKTGAPTFVSMFGPSPRSSSIFLESIELIGV